MKNGRRVSSSGSSPPARSDARGQQQSPPTSHRAPAPSLRASRALLTSRSSRPPTSSSRSTNSHHPAPLSPAQPPAMADSGAQGRTTKAQQVTAAPFVSHVSVQQALETNDPTQLQAGASLARLPACGRLAQADDVLPTALTQIDNRAAALNAKPQPRAQPDLLLDYLKHDPGCQGVFASWDLSNKVRSSLLRAPLERRELTHLPRRPTTRRSPPPSSRASRRSSASHRPTRSTPRPRLSRRSCRPSTRPTLTARSTRAATTSRRRPSSCATSSSALAAAGSPVASLAASAGRPRCVPRERPAVSLPLVRVELTCLSSRAGHEPPVQDAPAHPHDHQRARQARHPHPPRPSRPRLPLGGRRPPQGPRPRDQGPPRRRVQGPRRGSRGRRQPRARDGRARARRRASGRTRGEAQHV